MAKYPIRQYGMVKKTENLDTKAIRTLISSHAENLRRTARINEKLDNLLALIKDADSIDAISTSNIQDNKMSQRINNIEGQNRQILDALAILTNYLKRLK